MSIEIDKLSDIYRLFDKGRPLGFRTVWDPNEFKDPYSMGDYYPTRTLLNFFINLPDTTLKYQFFNSKNADIYKTIYKKISLDSVVSFLKTLAKPIYAGFRETTGNKEFRRYENDFLYDLFFNESIFVSYNFFSNKENYIIKDRERYNEIKYFEKVGGFNTWIKVTGKEYDEDCDFIHIKTGIVFEIPDWLDKLAPAKWTSYKNNNFTNWFEFSILWLTGVNQIMNAEKLVNKRVHIYGNKNLLEQKNDIEERLEAETSILTNDINQKIDIVPKIFMDGNDLNALKLTTFDRLDRWSYELGRVSNTNPKGDRYSTGENYKDITGIAARQKEILNELDAFADYCLELWGIPLNFAVNGIPQTESMEEDQAEAENPNTDKKPDATSAVSPTGK